MNFFDLISFPSKSDWIAITNEFPIIKQLSIRESLSLKEDSIKNIADALIKPKDFSNWRTRFTNKLEKLRFSYILLIYYSKHLPDKNWVSHNDDGSTKFFQEFQESDHYKKFMFDYFTESFYYHYFSAVDVVSYLLNLFYDLNIRDGISFSKDVHKKIPDNEMKQVIREFLVNTKLARNGRNALTHKFPFNQVDMRSKRVDDVINIGTYDYRPSMETTAEIQKIIIEMEKLLRTIEVKMKND